MQKVLLVISLFISSLVGAQTTTVYFEFNSFMLNNEARNTLNKFIASGKINSVGFFGHTDQSGRTEYNEWLSVQRALTVKDYLLSKGLKESNVSVVRGFGAERLITTDPDSASQLLNRRVTITNGYKPNARDIAAVAKQTPIYYTTSPTLPKLITDSTAITNSTAKAREATSTKETNTVAEIKQNIEKSTAEKEKQTTSLEEKSIVAKPKETPVVKRNDSTDEALKSSTTKAEQKATIDSAKTAAEAVETTTKSSTDKPEVKAAAPGSFADRLSKAVSKSPDKPSTRNNTEKTSTLNTAAPVVKQQKHEKLIEDIQDKSTKEGEHIVLRHIHFYGGRHAFLPQAYPALDDLLETMQKVPTLKIEIQGHICCQDGEGDQIDFDSGEPVLSITRAKAVYDFLLENGIDKSRMTYKGLAHKFPIVKVETTEEEATINRRVEIKIIKK